jgi:hypothetical protein
MSRRGKLSRRLLKTATSVYAEIYIIVTFAIKRGEEIALSSRYSLRYKFVTQLPEKHLEAFLI